MEVTYRQEGDYELPNLTLTESAGTYGKYGMLRRTYLAQHRRGTYSALLLQGKLNEHLAEIDRMARAQVEQTAQAMMQDAGVSEQLKAEHPMDWTGRVNTIRQQAAEIVLHSLLYK